MKELEIMKELENHIEKDILPYLKEKILAVYRNEFRQASIKDYLKAHSLTTADIADFGLPSGTIWIVRCQGFTFRKAKELGLQFPTKEQIEELMKCKRLSERFDAWHCHVRGPNGYETGIYDSCHSKLCIWADDAVEDTDFMVEGYIITNNDFTKQQVYVGDIFSTLFVVPQDLNK